MMNNLKINIDENGVITEIGFVPSYQHECPKWINHDNATQWTCINCSEVDKEESWQFTPIVDLE